MSRTIVHTAAIVCLSGTIFCLSAIAGQQNPRPPSWPFFAFDNGVGRDQEWSPDRQAATLARLGYSGIGYTDVKDVENRLTACESRSIRIVSFYEPFRIDSEEPVSTKTLQRLPLVSKAGAVLWIHLHGEASEEKAVLKLQELADLAAEHDVRVAIYPHVGNYVETASHALKLAEQVDRSNFGMSINVCHELRAGNADELPRLVRESIDHLFLVSINGADRVENAQQEHGWSRLIRPLGEGDFDLRPMLIELRRCGYEGPIGLQCYRVNGEPEVILENAMTAWREILSSLPAEEQQS